MPKSKTIERRHQVCVATLAKRGQSHALRWWEELDRPQRKLLLDDLESIPWDLLDGLIETHVRQAPSGDAACSELTPPNVHRRPPGHDLPPLYQEATTRGRELLAAGRVAAFTVAGGQGTRLGFDGPKGALSVTPVGDRTLFEIFAETVKAARLRYDTPIPWYIMTSPANHEQTVEFLSAHGFFGLPERDVILFSQGMLPALDKQGKLLLAEKHRLALAPDGHGGTLKALVRSGALADMRSRGVTIISYFQVDNPLVKPFDPLFIGLHEITSSEMSDKVASKADDLEKVGNVCLQDGKTVVIEYSDFPRELAHAKDADGRRLFDAGNLAIHLIDVDFVDRIVGRSFQLPFRRAEKTVPCVDENGSHISPKTANAVKLETFIFDALPLANNPLLLEVDRAEEFSPVKQPAGVDSLQSAKRDQVLRACRWLEAAGVAIPRNEEGRPDLTIAIAPSFALDAEDVSDKVDKVPVLAPGDAVYLT